VATCRKESGKVLVLKEGPERVSSGQIRVAGRESGLRNTSGLFRDRLERAGLERHGKTSWWLIGYARKNLRGMGKYKTTT
jgi:hypothetical protein